MKTIDFSKTVYELCSFDPAIKDILSELGFQDITKPGMLSTAGRFMTIPKGAAMKKMSMVSIQQEFKRRGYEIVEKE
ncbi:MAG: DUF1858 domain-containing protein [Clostridia bacterium]